jgi:hypothetical protein
LTQAKLPMSEDISYRQRRYPLMMGIRVVCFVGAVVMFVNHLGGQPSSRFCWPSFIPCFAVVFANGGRDPTIPVASSSAPVEPAHHPG